MRRRVLAVGAVLAALLVSAVATSPAAVAGGDPNGGSSHEDSAHITGTYPTVCHAKRSLPDPSCTPGARSDAVTQDNVKSTVCTSGYTDKVRPTSAEAKRTKTAAMKAYNVPSSARAVTQLDHLIPLELGGNSEVANLWPERGLKSYRKKDAVERKLHTAVCDGKVQLKAAQDAVAHNWTTALTTLGIH